MLDELIETDKLIFLTTIKTRHDLEEMFSYAKVKQVLRLEIFQAT